MAVAAAEQTHHEQIPNIMVDFGLPLVEVIPETMEDVQTRQRAAQFIGAVAVGSWERNDSSTEAALTVKPIESLHQAIHEATRGDQEARAMVEVNVRTDVIERTMKAGHVMEVDLMVDAAGRIQQHGQSMNSVQANSLRYAANSWQMRQRTEAETRNAFRIEERNRNGELEDYYFVVMSRAADNMTSAEMKQAGFFETRSCALQLTSTENSRLVTETAFVSGVKSAGEARHDEATVVALAARFDIDLAGKTATEILDTPLKIHKSLLPNGAIDLVKMYDEAAGGTFFGESKPAQDYLMYKQVCAEREARFAPKVEKIVHQLLQEAETITSPLMATQRLHKISEEQMIEQAIGDDDIDPRVFGAVSARAIIQGRLAYELGHAEQLIEHVETAKANARSSSCPGAGSNSANNESDEDSTGTCEFISKSCPMCGAKNVKTTVTKTRITGSCKCSKAK